MRVIETKGLGVVKGGGSVPAILTMPARVRRTFALLRSLCMMFLEWMKYLRLQQV